jgi:hypothetical protein
MKVICEGEALIRGTYSFNFGEGWSDGRKVFWEIEDEVHRYLTPMME